MSKPGKLPVSGDKSTRDLNTDRTAAGVEVPRARYRLLQGTGESSDEMSSEKSERKRVAMLMGGADKFVVAMKGL